MGNAWYVLPLTADLAQHLTEIEAVSVPPGPFASAVPTPNQVFATVGLFPEYRVTVRRRDTKGKGQAIDIDLRRADGSYAIEIHLLGVVADDQPARTFVFCYYQETEELVRLVAKLVEPCGPLVLYHDGGETSVVVN